MDWVFVNVEDWGGGTYRIACFCMVCHHCGTCYVEFFLIIPTSFLCALSSSS